MHVILSCVYQDVDLLFRNLFLATGRKTLATGFNELDSEKVDDTQQFLKDILAFLATQKSEATKVQGLGLVTSTPDQMSGSESHTSRFNSESGSASRRSQSHSAAESPQVSPLPPSSLKSGTKRSPSNRKVHPHNDSQDLTGNTITADPECSTRYVCAANVGKRER